MSEHEQARKLVRDVKAERHLWEQEYWGGWIGPLADALEAALDREKRLREALDGRLCLHVREARQARLEGDSASGNWHLAVVDELRAALSSPAEPDREAAE